MTVPFERGRYGIRLAQSAADLAACQALRHACFHGRPGLDEDGHDAACSHVMIAGHAGLAGTFRLRHLRGQDIFASYAAESYDLSRLAHYPTPMLELGRFCVAPEAVDADVLRMAWGMLAQIVDDHGIGLVFGCASFAGLETRAAGFGLLARRHTAPALWAPGVRAAEVVPLVDSGADAKAGLREIPPLLRSYLNLGGWVSDHAVVDRTLQTLHVFTAVEIDRVPPARARALRSVMRACS